MSESFRCGDEGALVAYLYEECEPAERAVIAAHLTACAACTGQVQEWSWTRRQVQAWEPPAAALGFQMTGRDVALAPGLVEPSPRPAAAWWRAPLPAWAQAAAAALVFGAGLSVGLAQGTRPAPEAATAAVEPAVSGVSPAELAALEERLRAEFVGAASRRGPVVATALADDTEAALLRRVRDIVEESAVEQRIELTERLVEFGRSVENQRRADLGFYSTALNRYQSEATTEIRQHREALDLLRVSLSR